MSNFAVLVIALACLLDNYGQCRRAAISKELHDDMKLEKRLKALNKPFIKTIVSEEGDVIDCVRYYDQPAFDHPALKNHKIQLRPTSFPFDHHLSSSTKRSSTKKVVSITLRGTREACPDGSVPIKRTTKQDLLDADSMRPSTGSAIAPLNSEATSYKQVNIRKVSNTETVTGASANIALYNLSIADDQTSSANIWLDSAEGPSGQKDYISVGWMVSHSLNGDGLTRLFGYWHNNRDNTGCYNTQCPGYVQVDKEIPINYAFQKTSVAGNNDQQFSTAYFVHQDEQTGNWWLTVSKDNVNVGYWPKELFPDLANGAHVAAWGGQTFPGSNGQFPPMGNGNKPNGLYRDTCYFDALKYYGDGQSYDITPSQIDRYVNGSDCYDLQLTDDREPLDITPFAFTFGGPGGTCTA